MKLSNLYRIKLYKEYKLGEPIIIRLTLNKNGDAIKFLQMKELVNIKASGTIKTAEGEKEKDLTATTGLYIVRRGDMPEEVDNLDEKRDKYLKLYPHIAKKSDNPEPYPQMKDFYDMPKGPFSLKKEINLEKILMITEPGKLIVRIVYDNAVDFYLDSGRRVKVDSWCGHAISNPVTITIK